MTPHCGGRWQSAPALGLAVLLDVRVGNGDRREEGLGVRHDRLVVEPVDRCELDDVAASVIVPLKIERKLVGDSDADIQNSGVQVRTDLAATLVREDGREVVQVVCDRCCHFASNELRFTKHSHCVAAVTPVKWPVLA